MTELPQAKLNRYGWRYLIGMFLWPFIQLALFLLVAQRTDIFRIWLCFAANLIVLPAGTLVVARLNPDILNYRGRRQNKQGIKTWDKILIRLFGLFGFHLPVIVAAFDWTQHQSTKFPLAVAAFGIVLLVAGNILFTWGMCVNRFFDTMVHIQADRRQVVVTSGPYQYVRHPGYTGAILWVLSAPLILGSAIALIPAVIGCVLLIVRTCIEDRMLRKELDGYTDYAARVRYRLIPGLW